MTPGKQFEKDWKNSVSKDVWYYRFRDGTSNWNKDKEGNVTTRFQMFNICDCLLFKKPNLFLLELKSTAEPRLNFTSVREKQYELLMEASFFDGIIAGLIVNFRKIEETYFMPIMGFHEARITLDRKSVSVDYFRDKSTLIPQHKLRVNYRYNTNNLIDVYKDMEKDS